MKEPKESLHVLNTREKKTINKQVSAQWGCEIDRSLVWLLSNKNKLYTSTEDIANIDWSLLRIDTMGSYIATVDDKGVRLSIEGSQMLGPKAEKNIVDIDKKELKSWLRGNDIERIPENDGFIIIRHEKDFVGCGKVTKKGIMNFVPKARRIAPAKPRKDSV
ncbi:hypothetical protein HQ545_02985 [Candidatus Woesearchaeota archaeon]|nr:hypothetical protein [Candidatus Woesearchaeota archaeon]